MITFTSEEHLQSTFWKLQCHVFNFVKTLCGGSRFNFKSFDKYTWLVIIYNFQKIKFVSTAPVKKYLGFEPSSPDERFSRPGYNNDSYYTTLSSDF